MKFEQAERDFQPVTITLESPREVALLGAVLSKAAGDLENDMTYKLYTQLSDIAYYPTYFNSKIVGDGIKIEEK